MVNNIFPITLSQAEVRRKGNRLVGPLDLTIGAEGFTILLGPNGAGKTTLLKTLHGMERLAAGARVWAVDASEAVKHQGFVFQTPVMLRRTVLENVAYPLVLKKFRKNVAQDEASLWLEKVGLDGMANRRASVLSGGERQKLALARALVTKPQLLLLDEPCANLDGRATREIEALLQDSYREGTRILMATHDLGQVRRLATDILFLHKGLLLEHCEAKRFLEAPETEQGKAFVNGDIVE